MSAVGRGGRVAEARVKLLMSRQDALAASFGDHWAVSSPRQSMERARQQHLLFKAWEPHLQGSTEGVTDSE